MGNSQQQTSVADTEHFDTDPAVAFIILRLRIQMYSPLMARYGAGQN
jgi:hypothetical protein